MAVNLRRDAWKDERQFDDIRNIALEIERLAKQTLPRIGDWTPGFTFGGSASGITYGLQQGIYVRTGQLVICFGAVNLTNNGSGVGAARLTGLPFFVKDVLNGSGADGFARFQYVNNLLTAMDEIFIYPEGGTNSAEIFKLAAGATSATTVTDTDFGNSTQVRPTLIYLTDDV